MLVLASAALFACSQDEGLPPQPRFEPPPVVTDAALSARVVDGKCQERGPGTEVPAGGTLQTAPTDRARIALSDGSFVVLDGDTRLVLDAGPRQVRLETGQGVFDVAPVAGAPPLKIALPRAAGTVAVLGTKLRVREDGGRALIDVSYGQVELTTPQGTKKVVAGQQGVMVAGSPPEIAAAPDLGQALGWARPGIGDAEAGIGSLRARRVQLRTAPESELRLSRHVIRASISGPVARTEIEQTFTNETDDELEGTYRFPLPAGARIASLALEVDGQFREGRFVDRSTGERIWRGVQKNARLRGRLGRVDNDDILFAPGPWRDPALLAWEAGNRFSIRIHPIRPHSSRTVRLAYVETLAPMVNGRRYVYPLPQGQWGSLGRSVADRVTVDVRITGHDPARPVRIAGLTLAAAEQDGARTLTGAFERLVPAGNLVVEVPEPAAGPVRTATYRDGSELFAVVALRPVLPLADSPVALDNVIVLDSSYSATGELWRRQVAVADALVREMGADDRVTVLTCDIGCRPVGEPTQIPSMDLANTLSEALARVEPGGTSDIVRSVEEASHLLAGGDATLAGRRANVVYIGDGIATVGVRDPARVADRAAAAAQQVHAMVSTMAVGTTSDDRTLAELARRTGGVAIGYAPGDKPTTLALRMLGRLRGATLQGATVELPAGAADAAPALLPAIHAGEELWVAARFTAPTSGDVVLRGTVDGRPYETRARVSIADGGSAGNAFVPQMWADKRVTDLAASGEVNREQIVALGTRYGLVTPFTSLLVLDSDALAERLGVGAVSQSAQWTGEEEVDLDDAESTGATETLAAPAPEPARPSTPAEDRDSVASEDAPRSAAGRAAPAEPRERTQAAEAAPSRRAMPDSLAPAQTAPRQAPATPAPSRPPSVAGPSAGHGAGGTVRGGPAGTASGAAAVIDSPVTIDPRLQRPGWWGGARPRVKVRVATIRPLRAGPQGLAGASQDVLEQLANLRAKLSAEPDRRRNHRDLARLFARIGEIEQGVATVRGWLSRDVMDAEALAMLADMLVRSGDRDGAIRALASIVEVQPGDRAAHQRMAELYERAGRGTDACAHRVTLAGLGPSDDAAAAAATRCQTSGGSPPIDRIAGNLVAGLQTGAGVDLDLAVVFRDGTRVSWLGGRRGTRAAEVTSSSGERLAIAFLPVGSYTIEVTRASVATPREPSSYSPQPRPVEGTVELRVLGQRRTIPFRLDGERSAVATVTVRTELR